tara:strand:- start:44 stop:778 length:735 start_codon:yes stop_codon:yes gene_type:complete
MKYSKDDILQMLISQYQFAIEFDPVVVKGMDFDYDSSIFDWRDACDLIAPKKLAKVYHQSFKLNRPISELENILMDENNRTVSDFCEYISLHAKRENIEPIKLLGQNCQTASIFRTLKQNLTEKGADTSELKPSSEINPFFLKYGGLLIDEVNRIAPGTMSEFEFKSHKLSRIGRNIMFIGIFAMIGIWWIWSFNWWLILPIIVGIIIFQIGDKKQPEKLNLGGFQNFRELIYGMENKLKKAST